MGTALGLPQSAFHTDKRLPSFLKPNAVLSGLIPLMHATSDDQSEILNPLTESDETPSFSQNVVNLAEQFSARLG